MEEKKKVGVLTLGCRVNQYETQACSEVFRQYGYEALDAVEGCDAYFVNTCSVTLESDRKSRQMIHKLLEFAKEKSAVVILCGCHIQAHPEEEYGEKNVFLCGNGDKAAYVRSVLEKSAEQSRILKRGEMTGYDSMSVSSSKNTRAFIKIEDGCDHFCSYCIVPHLRGKVRSRDPGEVLREVERLAANGFREVVLTGIETSCYGQDLPGEVNLCDLAEKISRVEGLERIRFGSLRPTLFTEEFTRRLSQIEKILPHFHLSVQSGSDKVLTMMRRDYTRRDVLKVFDILRAHFPRVTFSADMICGFPGESEADFLDTVDVVEKGMLLHTHIFPFSERPGTPAGEMKNQVGMRLRKERCARLLSHSDKVARETIRDFAGQSFRVLVEKVKGSCCFGYTENFIHTEFHGSGLNPGDVAEVILDGSAEQKTNILAAKGRLASE